MEAAQARLNLHLSKYNIVGNHMSRLKYLLWIKKSADEKKGIQNYPVGKKLKYTSIDNH